MDDLKTKNKVAGLKQTRRLVESGRAARVYLADDASGHIKREVFALCESFGVECVTVSEMTALGRACGVSVSTAAAAIIKSDSDGKSS